MVDTYLPLILKYYIQSKKLFTHPRLTNPEIKKVNP